MYETTIEQVTDEEKGFRFYKTPEGDFPSVTTVLATLSKEYLDLWRERVGEEEAKKVSDYAKARGTRIHSICETYLNNTMDSDKWAKVNLVDQYTFRQMKPCLDRHVNNIRAQELGLYSKFLQSAGTVDLIADWDGKLSVIDFKTSRRYKAKDQIKSYFMQTSAYAIMWEELFKEPITQTVIIMAVDNAPTAQVYVEKRNNYAQDYINLRQQYKGPPYA